MVDAFNIVPTSSPREIRTMRALVRRMVADEHENILLASDWADFLRRKGRIQALEEVGAMLEQLEVEESK